MGSLRKMVKVRSSSSRKRMLALSSIGISAKVRDMRLEWWLPILATC